MSSSVSQRPRPIRWAIAFLVTIAMLVATTGVVVFAQTGSSGGPAFAPATTVAWAELRLDLPGNQKEELSALLGHLPGFADPAALDAKVSEMLDQVVSQASDGAASWTGDVDPWSDRQFGVAVLELPVAADAAGANEPPPMVIGLGVKDRAALEARLATFLTQEPIASEPYAGSTVITVSDDVSFAVTDRYLLVAPRADDVRTALDVLAGNAPSLAEDDGFATAAERIPGDRLGAFYFALSALRPLIESQLIGQPGADPVLDLLDQLPAWVSGYVQASSDHLTVAVDMQTPASLPLPSMRETDLASHFASGSVVYLEVRDVGRTFHTVIEQLLAQMPADDAQGLAQIEQLLGAPVEELLDPIEDLAVGIGLTDGLVDVGLAAILADPAAAQTRVTNLLALVRVFAAQGGATITETDVAGVPVTTITVAGADGLQTGSVPVTPSVSVAIADDHLYIGLGDFVERALTQDAGASLASDARFGSAVAAAGTPNSGFAFVDLAGAQALFESMGRPDAQYLTDVKPWLDALDSLVLSAAADADALTSRFLLFVR